MKWLSSPGNVSGTEKTPGRHHRPIGRGGLAYKVLFLQRRAGVIGPQQYTIDNMRVLSLWQ